jgi:DNA-binding PadR family transcriptional regulator
MKIEEVYQFFAQPPKTYLSTEQAACYVLSVLLQKESYGTELIRELESKYPAYQLSDTVLYAALKFLESETAIAAYWKKAERRGRPRRMYQLNPEWQHEAQKLAALWTNSTAQQGRQQHRVLAV